MQCRSSERSSTSQVRHNAFGVCVARWYDPGTGQFMSVDPDLAETDQPYAYAADDPVNEGDPSGLYCAGTVGETECPNPLPGPPVEYPISGRFVQWVAALEGTCSSSGQWCYVQGNCQIGYGHDANDLITPNVGCGATSVEGFRVPLSQPDQVQLLKQDLTWIEIRTAADIPAPLTSNQTYALTDFAYALGTGYFAETSPICSGPCSLFDYLTNAGVGNPPSAATASKVIQLFENYNSGGEDANRRYDEAILFLYGRYTVAPYPGTTASTASYILCGTSTNLGSVV
ncbi:MAG TPA: RHS repeat-associated core domain-containing protein [Acidimicrobiales bacterium]|nr:RHS repeat-associated core domain-containing protein [Acidimicrobiales bacterium]